MIDPFLVEIQQGFLEEATILLEAAVKLSLQLEKDPTRADIYLQFARLAHNFKGTGKAVGFNALAEMAHGLEDYVIAIEKGTIPSSPSNLDFLFQCLDRLSSDVECLKKDLSANLDHTDIMTLLALRISHSIPAEKKSNPVKALQTSDVAVPKKAAVLAPPSSPPPIYKAIEIFRIPKHKLDFLLESVGEQVILQLALERCKLDVESTKDILIQTISQLSKLTFDLQRQAFSLSFLQLTPLFDKLERAARDAAKTCGKEIKIELLGGETEVDKTLIDALIDPLIHMIRNAVDHGIETLEERKLASKPDAGTLKIQARQAEGRLWLQIQDDGKGMDPNHLKTKAVKKGIITQNQADSMSQEDAFKLIFTNGFSTKEAVNELSGRGVGMNVVQETVNTLKGTIEINSKPGLGTEFKLKFPLSLAIFNGAIVRILETRFVVPNSEISEISRIRLSDRVPVDQGTYTIKIRDELFELIDLREKLFGRTEPGDSALKEYPVLLQREGKPKAFLVNEILTIQKIVKKPLGDEIKCRQEYSAGTILNDGMPGVILNLNSIGSAA